MKYIIVFLILVASSTKAQVSFSSPLTEYVSTPADGKSMKYINREIILDDDQITSKTHQKEGDTDIEIWTKTDYEIRIKRDKGRIIRTFHTYMIFKEVRINAIWDFVDDGEGKIEMIFRTLTNERGDEPLVTRYHID